MNDTLDKTLDNLLAKLRNDLDRRVDVLREELDSRPEAGREIALVITKMQEARLWAGEALKERGYYKDKEKV